ncbi:MAG: DNA/RNA non-specific endonuclease [Paludibacteraceae bacterium]|nr:DNA/RNA non-specific endonuclease [Paludibacteraceae bacterium]
MNIRGILHKAFAACTLVLASCSYHGVGHVVSNEVGVPTRRPFRGERLVVHQNYCTAFKKKTLQPAWVAWTLSANETVGSLKRTNNFVPDASVRKRYRVETKDYSGSGYDRGHMCPAADNKHSEQAMSECFYMTNMCPQLHELNAGAWQALEDSCRLWAQREDSIVVVAGPVFYGKHPATIGKQHKVAVPDAFFKIVVSLKPGNEKAIAFLFPHNRQVQSVGSAVCTVRSLEQLLHFNFFPKLPKQLQERLENNSELTLWAKTAEF